MPYIVGVDVGGTCTDCAVIDTNGRLVLGKALTTTQDFSDGIFDAIEVAAQEIGVEMSTLINKTLYFMYSSTIAENMIITGDYKKAGLLTTRGFEGTLFIMRGGYGRWCGLTDDEMRDPIRTDRPPTLIPIDMIKGIKERTDHKGLTLIKIEKSEVKRAARELVEAGATAIGVCFLWSFRNPQNESDVKNIIKESFPDLFVTISSELCPSLGEYERMSTIALNSCLGLGATEHLDHLNRKLKERSFQGSAFVMQSYGGTVPIDVAPQQAVGMFESGPVSSLVSSRITGDLIGLKNIIAADMGGTTFKVGTISNGRTEYQVEPIAFRYPYSMPKIDIASIGCAGGSIISIEPRTNLPKVGPRSAGSFPGPVCFDRGGEEPTITDVDLILGFLSSDYFLGGRVSLDKEKAINMFNRKIAEPLGLDTVTAASGIYKLVNSMIYDLIHKVTIERGLDPRKYALFSYGGSGGTHLAWCGEKLRVKEVVVPYTASVQGAFGVASSDIVHEFIENVLMVMPLDCQKVNEIFQDLEDKAIKQALSEGFEINHIRLDRSMDMRYGRQAHVCNVPVEAPGLLSDSDIENISSLFDKIYEQRYGKGSAYREAGVHVRSLRVRVVGPLRKVELARGKLSDKNPREAFMGNVYAYAAKNDDILPTKTYDFQKLLPGNEMAGPAIVYTPITTVLIDTGQKGTVDNYKNIRISFPGIMDN